MTNNRLLSLAEANNIELVGGKAHALSKMIRSGFNVPDGFVVPASAFLGMTPSLKRLVLVRYDELRAQFVAVRSSAINEDGADHAWAGQLETSLNCTRHNLLESIQNCWQSAYSARAQSYAAQKSIASTKVAVIVQEMIQSEISGVAFSAHPISHDDKQVVIEAGFGLGEAIVSGQITPDTYIVSKKTGRLVEKHLSKQLRKLVRDNFGATTWQEVGAEGDAQKLTDAQIKELCNLTQKLESFFKHPVDVEWAIGAGVIYILQSRPITTLTQK